MKKRNGKRILAGFLALLLVLTSFTWDFGGADVAKAEDAATAITATEDSLKINFEDINITELDNSGYTSTRFKSNEALVGEVNRKVSEHWFSGNGVDTLYGDADETTITGKNKGIKSNDITESDTRTIMYTPCSYEDFTVSAEIYYGAFSGIVIGEKNVYPTESNEASSVALFFDNGRIHVMGAVDCGSAKIMRGTKAGIANNGNKVGYKIFNNGSGDEISSKAGNVYTVNVKKTGNHLIVWYSGGTGLMTIKLTDAYKTGAIGIQSRAYDGDNGGFKFLNIEKVHATEHHELDEADITELDNLGYSATLDTTVVNNSVGNAFFSGTSNSSGTLTSANEGLKGTTTEISVSGLNIPYIYENFRLEAEVYSGQLIGVAVGNASSTPRAANMLSTFYNMHAGKIMLQMEGAYSGSWTRVGGAAGAGNNNFQWRPTLNGSAPTDVRDTEYTLVLEVRDGKATLWMEGYDGYVTATLADTYVTEKIALIARHSSDDKGGIKGYTITNLDAGDYADFDNVYLQNLTAAGYTASDCADSELKDKAVSEVWFSGQSNYSTSETNMNNGLKPSDTDGSIDLLNLPEVYDNFRLKATMYHGQVVGVGIGKKGAKLSTTGVDNGGVAIYTNANYVELTGSIDSNTANLTAGTGIRSVDCFYHYIPTDHTTAWNKEKTLVVEMQDGILSVWMEGYAGVLRVRVTDEYVAGNIALIARRHNTSGNPGGGLKDYTIEKLPSANTGTTVDIAGYTDFNHVDTNILYERQFTSTQFATDENYNVVGNANQAVENHWFAGEISDYATDKLVKSGNTGLKPYTSGTASRMTLLNTPYTYEDFRVSTEVYWGAYTGIVLGEKNVFPTTTTDSAVRIYFNSDQIQLVGAGIDPNTAVVSEGATWTPSSTSYIFKPKDYSHEAGKVFELNVEKKNDVLTVWVEGYEGSLSVKTTDTFKQESIALMARNYNSDDGGLKSLTVEALTDVVIPYTAEDFAKCREDKNDDGAYTNMPKYKNYLFAGWFTDAACTKETAVSASTEAVENEVYAKFIPQYVLGVKAQVSAHLTDGKLTEADEKGAVRFLTSIDSVNYKQVGIKATYNKGDGEVTKKTTTRTVYSKLFQTIGDSSAYEEQAFDATVFCGSSKLIKALTLKGIGENLYDMEFKVTPFYKTLDGTIVEGETVVKTVNSGINKAELKNKTALLVGDFIQYGNEDKPANDYKEMAWAGRLERQYGMTTEKVAKSDAATLTNTTVSGADYQIKEQLEATSEDYDFVLLEGGIKDITSETDIDWGTIVEDKNATFCDNTIAGAMQDLIKTAQSKYGNSEIVYLITKSSDASDDAMKAYVDLIKDACRVHGISYVDLSDVTSYDAAGYEKSTPILATHLRKLITGELVDTVYVAEDANNKIINVTFTASAE